MSKLIAHDSIPDLEAAPRAPVVDVPDTIEALQDGDRFGVAFEGQVVEVSRYRESYPSGLGAGRFRLTYSDLSEDVDGGLVIDLGLKYRPHDDAYATCYARRILGDPYLLRFSWFGVALNLSRTDGGDAQARQDNYQALYNLLNTASALFGTITDYSHVTVVIDVDAMVDLYDDVFNEAITTVSFLPLRTGVEILGPGTIFFGPNEWASTLSPSVGETGVFQAMQWDDGHDWRWGGDLKLIGPTDHAANDDLLAAHNGYSYHDENRYHRWYFASPNKGVLRLFENIDDVNDHTDQVIDFGVVEIKGAWKCGVRFFTDLVHEIDDLTLESTQVTLSGPGADTVDTLMKAGRLSVGGWWPDGIQAAPSVVATVDGAQTINLPVTNVQGTYAQGEEVRRYVPRAGLIYRWTLGSELSPADTEIDLVFVGVLDDQNDQDNPDVLDSFDKTKLYHWDGAAATVAADVGAAQTETITVAALPADISAGTFFSCHVAPDVDTTYKVEVVSAATAGDTTIDVRVTDVLDVPVFVVLTDGVELYPWDAKAIGNAGMVRHVVYAGTEAICHFDYIEVRDVCYHWVDGLIKGESLLAWRQDDTSSTPPKFNSLFSGGYFEGLCRFPENTPTEFKNVRFKEGVNAWIKGGGTIRGGVIEGNVNSLTAGKNLTANGVRIASTGTLNGDNGASIFVEGQSEVYGSVSMEGGGVMRIGAGVTLRPGCVLGRRENGEIYIEDGVVALGVVDIGGKFGEASLYIGKVIDGNGDLVDLSTWDLAREGGGTAVYRPGVVYEETVDNSTPGSHTVTHNLLTEHVRVVAYPEGSSPEVEATLVSPDPKITLNATNPTTQVDVDLTGEAAANTVIRIVGV